MAAMFMQDDSDGNRAFMHELWYLKLLKMGAVKIDCRARFMRSLIERVTRKNACSGIP
jgi:hypothetical protein